MDGVTGKRMEIRPAVTADAGRLAALYAIAHAETYAPVFGPAYLPLDPAATEAISTRESAAP